MHILDFIQEKILTQTETTAKPSQESFSELLDQSFQEMTSIEGSVVSGTVISIEKDMIIIDVGLKCEGRVPLREFGNNEEEAKINVCLLYTSPSPRD